VGLPHPILPAGSDLDISRGVDTDLDLGRGVGTGIDRRRDASDAGITMWDFRVRFFLQVRI